METSLTIGADAADSPAGIGTVGLYHLAWEVDTLTELHRVATVLAERGDAGLGRRIALVSEVIGRAGEAVNREHRGR